MTLILSGTDGLSDIDGSAATPAIRGTDTNTGIFFPAADTIAFSEGGVEAMRIDSSGNVGIGTSSPVGKVESKTATVTGGSADYAQKAFVANISYSTTNVISSLLSGWDSSAIHGVDVGYTYNGTGYNLIFSTNDNTSGNPIERARITSGGDLLVGTTTSGGRLTAKSADTSSSSYGLFITDTTNTLMLGTRNDGYLRAPIVYNQTSGSAANVVVDSNGYLYRSTSSRKYKRDIEPAIHGLAEVMQLRSVTYKGNPKNDGEKIFGGLIAEEVHDAGLGEFVQYAEDGSPDALAYGNMVSLCVKAIQEQQAIIQSLTARIEALEGK